MLRNVQRRPSLRQLSYTFPSRVPGTGSASVKGRDPAPLAPLRSEGDSGGIFAPRGLQSTRKSAVLVNGPRLFVSALVCAWCLPITPAHAQQPDQFISTIEKMKTGIAPVTCARATAPNKNTGIHGMAFFIDTHGAFLTAGHVIKSIVGDKDGCETPTVLVRVHGTASENLDLYGLKFVASDCRVDENDDIARCKTVADPTRDGKIATKPVPLTIATDIQPDGTPVAFTGFSANDLTPYTARANIAGISLTAARRNPCHACNLQVSMAGVERRSRLRC